MDPGAETDRRRVRRGGPLGAGIPIVVRLEDTDVPDVVARADFEVKVYTSESTSGPQFF